MWLRQLEEILQYRFEQPLLAAIACSSSTLSGDFHTAAYLGDGAMELVVRELLLRRFRHVLASSYWLHKNDTDDQC